MTNPLFSLPIFLPRRLPGDSDTGAVIEFDAGASRPQPSYLDELSSDGDALLRTLVDGGIRKFGTPRSGAGKSGAVGVFLLNDPGIVTVTDGLQEDDARMAQFSLAERGVARAVADCIAEYLIDLWH